MELKNMKKENIEVYAEVARSIADITQDIEIHKYLTGFSDAMSLVYSDMDKEEIMEEVKIKGNYKTTPKTICELCGKDYSIYGNDGVCDECGAEIKKSLMDAKEGRISKLKQKG